MSLISQNGKGGAAILPPVTKVINGRGVAHRHLDARQRAILAANVADGIARFVPSQKQLANVFDVSVPYVQLARKLSLEKRSAILDGLDRTSFVDLMDRLRRLTSPLAVANISDAQLMNVARIVGADRRLEAAAAAESSKS